MSLSNILGMAGSSVIFIALLIIKLAKKNKAVHEAADTTENLNESKEPTQAATKKKDKSKTLLTVGMIISAWYFAGTLLNALDGRSGIKLVIEEFSMFSERINLFGISVAQTTVIIYGIVIVVAVLCLLFRFLAIPKFTEDTPRGLQNVIEAAIEATDNLVRGVVGDRLGDGLTSYMFSVAVFMLMCAFSELFGLRAPTSDLLVTFSLALTTLFLINFYGIRQKGFGGRIKFLASPTPFMMPMKIVSDIAVPVSLACRLFGNMLGGLIVMDLLKSSLGGYAVGMSSALGLFFNLFHPAIQTYIFVILSLTFINEAAE